jgi:hypothetical protein
MVVRVANNGIIQSTERGTLRVPTAIGSDIVKLYTQRDMDNAVSEARGTAALQSDE